MFALSFISAAILGVSAVVATLGHSSPSSYKSCSLANAKAPVVGTMAVPTTPPAFIGLGVGVQNYTCNATTGTYVSAGAVAELFDLSCFYQKPEFNSITNISFGIWANAPSFLTTQEVIQIAGVSPAPILGQHYFVHPTPDAALSPEWDFTSSGATKGNSSAYVIGAKDISVLAARPTIDVPALQLHGASGGLASKIYRLETVNGQPPASCTGSGPLSVKYTALYYLYA